MSTTAVQKNNNNYRIDQDGDTGFVCVWFSMLSPRRAISGFPLGRENHGKESYPAGSSLDGFSKGVNEGVVNIGSERKIAQIHCLIEFVCKQQIKVIWLQVKVLLRANYGENREVSGAGGR